MKTFIVLIPSAEKLRIKADKAEMLMGSGTAPILRFVNCLCGCQRNCNCDQDHVIAELQWPCITGYFEQDAEA